MSLEETMDHPLEWRQTALLRRAFQLMDGEEEVGSLRFVSTVGTRAAGEYRGKQWTFKRTGFLTPKITVRAADSENDLAVFTPGWNGKGWVAFAAGPRFHLQHKNFWGTEWVFEREDGTAVVALSGRHGMLKQHAAAGIAPGAESQAETPVLLLLIWYVRILVNADAASTAVIASTH